MGRSRSARHAVPILLLAVLTLATAAAAVVGATATHRSSPPSFVPRSLAATTEAGSARFTFALITKASGNPGGTSTGFGSINFSAGTSDIAMTMHNTESVSTQGGPARKVIELLTLQEIHTPHGTYQRSTFANTPAGSPVSTPWVRVQHFPVPSGPFGLLRATPIGVAVTPLLTQPSVFRWRPVDTATIGGTSTTEYQRSPALRRCTTKGAGGLVDTASDRVSLWLDRRGRIRQIQAETVTDEHGDGQAAGVYTTLGTLTFSSFGGPVVITDPTVGGGGAFSEGLAISGRSLTTTCSP